VEEKDDIWVYLGLANLDYLHKEVKFSYTWGSTKLLVEEKLSTGWVKNRERKKKKRRLRQKESREQLRYKETQKGKGI
jgi:hypothetical protein